MSVRNFFTYYIQRRAVDHVVGLSKGAAGVTVRFRNHDASCCVQLLISASVSVLESSFLPVAAKRLLVVVQPWHLIFHTQIPFLDPNAISPGKRPNVPANIPYDPPGQLT